MAHQKISFITTVYNEEAHIEELMNSLTLQTIKPDEIVIVDAFSTDKTYEILENFRNHHEFKSIPITITRKKGNRSVGRNEAVQKARYEVIVATDAGCTLDSRWIAELIKPFNDTSVDVVGGYYKPVYHTVFQKCLATYTSVMPDKFDEESFLPSSRSIAFKKEAWKKAGGYPEWLDYCEDLVFVRSLKEVDAKFRANNKALVHWPQRETIWQAAQQFFHYAIGDGMALYFRKQTPLLFIRYIIGAGIVIISIRFNLQILWLMIGVCLIGYVVWAISKNFRYVNHPLAFIYLPLLQFVSDGSVISGTIVGLTKRIWGIPNKH